MLTKSLSWIVTSLVLLLAIGTRGESTQFPLSVSANGRYLVTKDGKPFLYQADTAWLLFYKPTLDQVSTYLENRKAKGFNAVQVQLLSEPGGLINCVGHAPLQNGTNLFELDEDFFQRAEFITQLAEQKGILVNIAPAWLGCCEGGCRSMMLSNGPAACRELGRAIGHRFADHPNVIWTLGGDRDPGEFRAVVCALAEGVRDSAPRQLMTAHAGSPNSAALVYPRESWLNINSTYTYAPEITTVGRPQFHVYAAALNDWNRTPVRPFILIETTYEGERNSKPQWLRRQAYWALLSGAAGHAFGNKPIYFFETGWQEALDQAGSVQMGKLKGLFDKIAWNTLVPDSKHQWVIAGYGTFFDMPDKNETHTLGTDYVTTAAAADGTLMVSYCPAGGTLTVQLSRFARPVIARWYDPVSGGVKPAASDILLNAGAHDFTCPASNDGGDADWVLLIQARSY